MKVLVVGPRSPDHLLGCLWDGLQEVLGECDVVDAVDSPWLHASTLASLCAARSDPSNDVATILSNIAGSRQGASHIGPAGGHYDLMVLSSSFNRDHDWEWVKSWMKWLRPGGKVAYLEGWDAAWQLNPPQMPVDACFRKEISPSVYYGFQEQHHLTFAAPSRWFHTLESNRPYDVTFIGNPCSVHPMLPELRWQMLSRVFATKKKHSAVVATRGIGHDLYFELLRQSKLALCPTAADGADSLRTYEAAACGAIPVFVGYPNHHRQPWFPNDCCINCTVETLADHLDDALFHDLTPMRERLRAHALEHQTTAARALKVLHVLGFKQGVDW